MKKKEHTLEQAEMKELKVKRPGRVKKLFFYLIVPLFATIALGAVVYAGLIYSENWI